jgi:hypothetical protein
LRDEGFSVFPDDNQQIYKQFINLVRVFLNPRYGNSPANSKRNNSFQELLFQIKNYGPDALLIDHILVGNHQSKTGLDLASFLREVDFFQRIPIMFLSRSEINSTDVLDDFSSLSGPKKWVHKGYSGREILDGNYIKTYVSKSLSEWLSSNENSDFLQKCKSILALPSITNDDKNRLDIIRCLEIVIGSEGKNVKDSQKKAIDKFYNLEMSLDADRSELRDSLTLKER